MSQAHSRGDASLDVRDDLTADERARARTGAPGERDAARRHRTTPAPDPLALRHRRRADRGRPCGDSGVASRGLDPQRGLGHGRDQRVAADAVSERVRRTDDVEPLPAVRRAGGAWASDDAGRERHLPWLDARGGCAAALLLAAAARHVGLCVGRGDVTGGRCHRCVLPRARAEPRQWRILATPIPGLPRRQE